MRKFFRNRNVLILFLICYSCLLIYLLFFAFFRDEIITSVNLTPFKSIVELTSYTFQTREDWWHWWVNVPGNVVAFIPISLIFVQLKKNYWPSILFLFLLPFLIEWAQHFFGTGACDVDDVILNTIGLLCGILISHKFLKQPAS